MFDTKEILGAVAGLIGVASAWIAYRTKVREAQRRQQSRSAVTAIGTTDDEPTKWSKKTFLCALLCAVLGTVLAIYIAIGLFLEIPLQAIAGLMLWAVVGAGIGVFVVLLWDRKSPGSVRASFTLKLRVSPQKALSASLVVLEELGYEIRRYDESALCVSAWVPVHKALFSDPRLLRIDVAPSENTHTALTVTVDSANPFARYDFGGNRRLARKVVLLLSRVEYEPSPSDA